MTTVVSLLSLSALIVACTNGDDTGGGLVPAALPLTVTVTLSTPGLVEAPLPGATVAIDDVDGNRVERVSDAEGVVEVAVDWDRQPFAVTVDPGLEPPMLASSLDITEDDRDQPFIFAGPTPGGLLTISGTAAEHDPDLALLITAHGAAGTSFQAVTATGDYSLQVLPGLPFELLAVDFTGATDSDGRPGQVFSNWTLVAHDGIDRDTTLDFAMGDDVDPVQSSGAFLYPEDPDDGLRGDSAFSYMMAMCVAANVEQSCGYPTRYGPDDQGDGFTFEAEHVRPALTEEMYTMAYATVGSTGSVVNLWDSPDAWTDSPTLLPVPGFEDRDTPSDDMTGWTFGYTDEVGIDGARFVTLLLDRDGAVVWVVGAPADSGFLAMPPPPSSVDVPALRDAASQVQPWLVRSADGVHIDARSFGGTRVIQSD